MKVVDKKGLVSMVESYVEHMDHRHMVVVLESHKEIHHSHWIDMHHRMSLFHSALVGVVAMRIDHMHMAPPTFGYPSLIHILIVISTSYNIVVITLIAKMRIHGEKRK